MLFLELGWETAAVRLGPSRFETDTGPVLREIDVEEEGAELIFPIVVVHEESSVVLVGVELLVWRQGCDVIENVLVVLFSLLALVGPSELPLGLAPRIPEPQQANRLLARLVEAVDELNDVVDGVGVVEDEAAGLALNLQLSLLSVTLDAATHETVVISSFLQELPESFGASVVLLDLLMREYAGTLVLDEDLFGLHASQLLDAFVDVA